MCGDQFVERVGAKQRRVAGQNDDRGVVVVVVAIECGHTYGRCVASAVLFDLLDECNVGPARRPILNFGSDLFAHVANHDGGAVGLELFESVNHVHDHRSTANEMQWLRSAGSHARALAGRENDGRNVHGSGGRNRTTILGTKNRCLAVRRPRIESPFNLPGATTAPTPSLLEDPKW